MSWFCKISRKDNSITVIFNCRQIGTGRINIKNFIVKKNDGALKLSWRKQLLFTVHARVALGCRIVAPLAPPPLQIFITFLIIDIHVYTYLVWTISLCAWFVILLLFDLEKIPYLICDRENMATSIEVLLEILSKFPLI